MSREIICSWLGVAPDNWPPDHYTLLGLPQGETDLDVIESHAQQRLELVRQYQLTHPDPATEAMNLLAKAFICLTDVSAKTVYDKNLIGAEEEPVATSSREVTERKQKAEAASTEVMAESSEPSLWLNQALQALQTSTDLPRAGRVSPSAVELPPLPSALDQTEASGSAALEETAKAPPAESGFEGGVTNDQEVIRAASTASARRGLTTKRAFYYRLARTRALLTLWEETGRYLSDPERRLSRPTEARELIEQLTEIRRALASFPLPVGTAGQPGYLVVSLARQQVIVPTFQTLLPGQREALARDWEAGRKLLQAHKDFLRQELQALKSRSWIGRMIRSSRALLRAYPAGWLLVLGGMALLIALVRQIF